VESFYVSPSVLGTESFLEVSPEGFSTRTKLPPGSWLLSGEHKNTGPMCLDSLIRLGGVDVKTRPDDRWTNMMKVVGCESNAPWSQVMPSSVYRGYVKNIVKTIVGNAKRLPEEYYVNTWHQCGQLFEALRPAKIDLQTHKSLSESGPGNGSLETFKPGAGGFAQVVAYDRFGTRTGRLTVQQGPQILTLKKEHRKILKSYYQSGSIISLDFSSLEARVLLYDAGRSPKGDVYEHVSNEIFGGAVPRAVVKVAVLSELYGASRSTLKQRLEMDDVSLDRFVAGIKEYFKTDELRQRLRSEYDSTGRIVNRFGRPLFLDGKNIDHLLVNTYAQSTGVDVSLLGFKSILNILGTDGIRPLYILHDALILDVRDDRIEEVESITSIAVNGYSEPFLLKAEKLC